MREEKSMIQLVKRYQTCPLSPKERLGLSLMLSFFLSMATLFIIIPKLF